MAQQTINIGAAANDGTGDPIRSAFTKVNSNFTELYEHDANNVLPGQTGNSGKYLTTNGTSTSWATIQPTDTVSATISSGALVVDLSKAIVKVSLTENITTITFTNAPASGKSSSTLVVLTQDGTGSRTVAGTGFLTASGLGLSVSSAPNSVSLISFLSYDNTTTIAFNVGQDYQ
jgi:hypothetical protein